MQSSPNINSGEIDAISTGDLQLLFRLYDQIFLDNWFKTNYRGKFKFSLSRRMTRSAGQTKCPKNIAGIKPEELTIEIRIGVDFFFQYDLVEGNKVVGGIATANSLEALQLVFEHELWAVVMVKDNQGQFADKQGNRYLKYYVPLNILEKQS